MKKFICLFLALVMMLSLTACLKSEEEKAQEALDAAVAEADDIFDKASDDMVRYKTKIAKDDGEEFYRVKATFSEDEFESVDEMKEYAEEEIIGGPYKKAKKVLKEVDLEIRVICCDVDGNECFYIVDGEISNDEKGEGGGDELETRPVESGKEPVESGHYYSGQDFTFLVAEYDSVFYRYNGGYIDAESMTGEAVNDKVYERNLAVEDQFGVKITTRVENGRSAQDVVNSYYMAGDFTFDVIYGSASQLGACVASGVLMDFNELEEVDYSEKYWKPSTYEDLTVAGRQFLSANDISMSTLSGIDCFYYNQTLAENLNLEATYGSPVEMVLDGTWTYDKMLEMIQAASMDIDGDGQITKNDYFGMIGGSSKGFLEGCGFFYTRESDSGFEIDFYNEKTLTVIKNTYNVLTNSKYVKSYDELIKGVDITGTGYDDVWQYARGIYANGHSLFMSATIDCAIEQRDMEDESIILPAPKYDSTQENYVSVVSNNSFVFALPETYNSMYSDAGPERTGVILDYMASKSNELLLPAFVESRTKSGTMDYDTQIEIIDIIHSTARFEAADIYGFTKTSETVDAMCSNPSLSASTYNRNKAIIQKELGDFYSAVSALD